MAEGIQPPQEERVPLSPDEIRERFRDVQATFIDVRQHPYGDGSFMPHIRRHFRRLEKSQMGRLVDSVGTLLSLSLEQAVYQGQVGDIDPFTVSQTLMDISLYLSRFSNTGVQAVYLARPIDF